MKHCWLQTYLCTLSCDDIGGLITKIRTIKRNRAEEDTNRKRAPRDSWWCENVNMAFLSTFSRHWRGVFHISRHRSHSLARTLAHSRSLGLVHHGQEQQGAAFTLGAKRNQAFAHPCLVPVGYQELWERDGSCLLRDSAQGWKEMAKICFITVNSNILGTI